jgi:hypothetical protein
MKTTEGTTMKVCGKCGGSGIFSGLTLYGNCYPCNGTGRVLTAAAAREQAAKSVATARAFWEEKLLLAEQLLANPFVTHYRALGDARRDAANSLQQIRSVLGAPLALHSAPGCK